MTRRLNAIHQRGATLIEVLVSILLMALGVLAMAAMQANAVQYGKASEFRSLATLLANDLADRMRANHPANEDMAAYNITDSYTKPTRPGAATKECTGMNTCLFSEMAAYDVAQWRRAVFDQLPEGTAYVSVTPKAVKPTAADIWIAWTDPGSASGSDSSPPKVDSCPKDFKQPEQVRCIYFHVVL